MVIMDNFTYYILHYYMRRGILYFTFDAPFIISKLLLREISLGRRLEFSFYRIGLTGKPETTPVDPVLNVACLIFFACLNTGPLIT